MQVREIHPNEWQVIATNHVERDALKWLFAKLVRGTLPKEKYESVETVAQRDGQSGPDGSEG